MLLLSVIIFLTEGEVTPEDVKKVNQMICIFSSLTDTEILVLYTSTAALNTSLPVLYPELNLRYLHRSEMNETSSMLSRNSAVAEASGRYLLLLSADQVLSNQLVDFLPEQMNQLQAQGGHAFGLYPCLELEQTFSAEIEVANELSSAWFSDVLSSYLAGNRDKAEYFSLNGGLLLRRHWFMAMGGFREEFESYEACLFDLVHRLAAYFPIGKKPEDYALDVKSQFVAGHLGYRRYYSFYAIPNLFNKHFTVKLWAEKLEMTTNDAAHFSTILASGPAGCRSLNLDLSTIKASSELGRKMLQRPFDSSEDLPLLQDYIHKLIAKWGDNQDDYQGLFQRQSGDKASPDGLRKRFRRLYQGPVRFFSRYFKQNKVDA